MKLKSDRIEMTFIDGLKEEGIIFLPVGEDNWFVGRVLCSEIEMMQHMVDVADFNSEGHLTSYMPTFKEIRIAAVCSGECNIQEGRPQLVQEATILELLRVVNRKFKERK